MDTAMKTKPSGFTLVELLVVITIIGILMGLLIPAVNSARETARRNQCSTQIKNLSLAAIQYENSKGELPGYIQSFGRFAGGSDPSDPLNGSLPAHMKIGTWTVALLPWLDAQPTYEHWSEDRYPIVHLGAADTEHEPTSGASGNDFHSLAAPNLAIMQCPSNPVAQGESGKNSYIANTGLAHFFSTTGGAVGTPLPIGGSVTSMSADQAFEESQSRANGVFNCKYNIIGGKHQYEGPKVRLDDFKDGAGNTMLFSENVQAMPWHRAGFIDAGNLPADETVTFNNSDTSSPAIFAARFSNGMAWHYADPDASKGSSFPWNSKVGSVPMDTANFTKLRINGGGTSVSDEIFNLQMTAANSPQLARPSSAHNDGVNAAMADGGTRFIPDSIDYRIYQALLTPRGKSSHVPWPEYVLDTEAF
ncbi:prepilin-type cleavage/methylation domain-containing protein [Rhodopirellula bahusiensis]|uniref:Prepilin-type cleavage/methylation domain-containing protein n=1 Tax=Rhodopirellula bahusiensis TaxID=2014065 RepID=A0A2G1W2T6_9BACT|nr:DUF1559 domain-containing protein [Rhodopirellula bahusiensis]PHQ33346.1 prepilin-type cleavage/methylation domain-containing protein [Rhodopirellula bahusiensis]